MARILVLLLFLWITSLKAQDTEYCKSVESIASMERQARAGLLAARTNPYTAGYDLKYCRFEWNIDPRVYYIRGTITYYFVPLQTGFDEINFELSQQLRVNQVRYRGQNLFYQFTLDDRLRIELPRALPPGALDSISVTYEGAPPRTGFGSFSQTFHNNNIPVIWTLSEPYGSKDWWPSKMDLNDKIDSIDVIVCTPKPYRAASNGLLVRESEDGNDKIYHWKHCYPITAYLVAVAVTDYAVYSDFVRLPGGDLLEILNYVYPSNLIFVNSQTFHTVQAMQLFNERFGVYPFAREKYGHAQFGFGGGMEHQTMSFMGGWSQPLQAHELAHQWFGNKITCGSWEDIWLNEGFATYLEGLTHEEGIGSQDFQMWLMGRINSVTASPGGSVRVNDTTSVNRIFNSRLSYNKGAMLLHMLRWKLGEDNFFQAVRNYLNDPQLAYGYARTLDLKRHLERQSGQNLTEFFNDWYYGEGYPSYRLEWQQQGGAVRMSITQRTSHPSVAFFEMPLPIRLLGINGERQDVRLEHTFSGQIFTVNVPFVVNAVLFDPDLWLISANNQVVSAATGVSDRQAMSRLVQIFPNPTKDKFAVDLRHLPEKIQRIDLLDAKGNLVSNSIIVQDNLQEINVANFPSGLYALRLYGENGIIVKTFLKQ